MGNCPSVPKVIFQSCKDTYMKEEIKQIHKDYISYLKYHLPRIKENLQKKTNSKEIKPNQKVYYYLELHRVKGMIEMLERLEKNDCLIK